MTTIESMYWVCSDALTLAAQLSSAQELPQAEVLRQRINALFSTMAQRARQVDVSDADLREATYALAAFMDEQILRSSWSGRQTWMAQPLQLVYFNENTAGEGFYQRLHTLEQTPGSEHLVEVYYLCIALGFQGRYAVAGTGDLSVEQDHARSVVARHLPNSETISPNGYPRSALGGKGRRRLPILPIGIGLCVLAIVVFVVLRLSIASDASSATDEMNRAHVAQSPTS
jgi:type VI secretion system protein ImpK